MRDFPRGQIFPLRSTLPSSRFLPYLALAFGVLVLGFSAIFVRWAAAPGPVMALYRLGMANLILTPAFLRHRRRSRAPLSRGWLLFPLLGGVMTALDHTVWNAALDHTTAANATLLNNTAPLWVALVAWLLFHERLRPLFWAGLALALAGAAAVLGSDFLADARLGWGDLLAVFSGLFYAGYFLATQRGRERLDTLSYIWITGVFSTITLLGLSLASRQPLTGYPAQTYLAFLGAAVISQLGGYLSVCYALGKLPASVVSPTMIGQPVVTALLALPLLGEALNPIQVLGGLTVLGGIYLVHFSRLEPRSRENPPAA
jgi:drug/metabolite transporter (DMT)-like permease